MSIGGIDGGLAGLYGPGSIVERTRPEDRTGGGAPIGTPDVAGTPARTEDAPRTAAATPSGPPEGVDPALWSVLTTEERDFFMKARDLGPITYRPGTPTRDAAPQRGGRVDVRV